MGIRIGDDMPGSAVLEGDAGKIAPFVDEARNN
jgi:hypothetical protein